MARHFFRWLMAVLCLIVALLPPGVRSAAAAVPVNPVPVLLIHGANSTAAGTWATALKFFRQQGYEDGRTLFTVDLSQRGNDYKPLGLFSDAAFVVTEIRRIVSETGAPKVDVVGHSRGGVIARLAAEGESAPLVRRAVSLDAPHAGLLSRTTVDELLAFLAVDVSLRPFVQLPSDLVAGSSALQTVTAREQRFRDLRPTALAIGTDLAQVDHPLFAGHDGIVSLQSQLAWPGATTLAFHLNIAPADLAGLGLAGLDRIPHVQSHEYSPILTAIYSFLSGEAPVTHRACDPTCADWQQLAGHWSEAKVRPFLPDRLPYTLDAADNRIFEPERPMTRAEFTYALVKMMRLPERLENTAFTDTLGHWALGYVQSAVASSLVKGVRADAFAPDAPLLRSEAATLVVRAKQWTPATGPSRFSDARGHWAEGFIEVAATNGIVLGDGTGFRPNDPVRMADGAIILIRAFGS